MIIYVMLFRYDINLKKYLKSVGVSIPVGDFADILNGGAKTGV